MAQIQFHHVHSSRPCGQLGKHKFVVRRRHHHHHNHQQQPYCQPIIFNSRLFLTPTEHLGYSGSGSSSSCSSSSSSGGSSSASSSSCCSSSASSSSARITDIDIKTTNNDIIQYQENNDIHQHQLNQRQQQTHCFQIRHHHHHHHQQQQHYQHLEQKLDLQEQQTPLLLIGDGYQPSNKMDPVYLEDDSVFYNLMSKESTDIKERELAMATHLGATTIQQQSALVIKPLPLGTASMLGRQLEGQLRHSILSWMLKVCDRQACQDEIFPLATMILDKFLLLHPTVAHTALNNNNNPSAEDSDRDTAISTATSTTSNNGNGNGNGHHNQQQVAMSESSHTILMTTSNHEGSDDDDEFYCDEQELKQCQLYLFAACSLLLATKLRQTPLLSVQILIEYSRLELPVGLTREEILDAELLVLATLKWDLATLVTPNDFLAVLLKKCQALLASLKSPTKAAATATTTTSTNNKTTMMTSSTNRCDESRVRRHTQTLLELCLMAGGFRQFNGVAGGELKIRQKELCRQRDKSLLLVYFLMLFNVAAQAEATEEKDSQLSQFPPSILAMASMAVAIDGLSMTEKTCLRLNEIVAQIHEATHKVNELKHMIEVASQIEKYVQKLHSTLDD